MNLRFWKQFLENYKTACILIVNTALLLVLSWFAINGMLLVLFHAWDHHLRMHNSVAQRYGGVVQEAYPDLTQAEIDDLIRETWDRPNRFMNDRFTGPRERPYTGRYVNIDPHGFRRTRLQGDWPPDPRFFNIFVFGGSTAFGYGVPDDGTIASWLGASFEHSAWRDRVRVYNFGRGGYYSTSERILFEQLLTAGTVPRMAIFIDGLNEFGCFADDKRGTDVMDELLRDKRAFLVREGIRDFVITEPVKRLADSFRTGVLGWWLRGKKPPPPDVPINDSEAKFVVDRYLANKKLIEAIARAYGVQPLFVWQPIPFYNYDLTYHRMGQLNPHRESQLGYRVAAPILKDKPLGKDFFWCADLQAGLRGGLYVDSIHYSSRMCRLIADSIFGFLTKTAWLPNAT